MESNESITARGDTHPGVAAFFHQKKKRTQPRKAQIQRTTRRAVFMNEPQVASHLTEFSEKLKYSVERQNCFEIQGAKAFRARKWNRVPRWNLHYDALLCDLEGAGSV